MPAFPAATVRRYSNARPIPKDNGRGLVRRISTREDGRMMEAKKHILGIRSECPQLYSHPVCYKDEQVRRANYDLSNIKRRLRLLDGNIEDFVIVSDDKGLVIQSVGKDVYVCNWVTEYLIKSVEFNHNDKKLQVCIDRLTLLAAGGENKQSKGG